MTTAELNALLATHGLQIDGSHAGAGKFRDLEIGVGFPYPVLSAFAADVRAAGHTANLTHVSNPDHPDHGKAYVELPSFWMD